MFLFTDVSDPQKCLVNVQKMSMMDRRAEAMRSEEGAIFRKWKVGG